MKPLLALACLAMVALVQPAFAQTMKVPNPYLMYPEKFSDVAQTPEEERAAHEESRKERKQRERAELERKKAERKMLVIDRGRGSR